MAAPEADLKRLARAALAEQGLDSALLGDALDIVAFCLLGRRYGNVPRNSLRRMVEVPFQRLVPDESMEGSTRGTILRGVIDLVFLKENGWVIVDYKTDSRRGRTIAGTGRSISAAGA